MFLLYLTLFNYEKHLNLNHLNTHFEETLYFNTTFKVHTEKVS